VGCEVCVLWDGDGRGEDGVGGVEVWTWWRWGVRFDLFGARS